MLWGRRRTRSAALTATTLTAVLLLTGCSAQVDAGSAGAVEAERELSGIDGVRSVRGSGTNNLPFAGTVSVVVTADDDLSDAQLLRVTHEVGRWIDDASGQGTTYSGSMEAGSTSLCDDTRPRTRSSSPSSTASAATTAGSVDG